MAKKSFNVRVDEEVIARLGEVTSVDHMQASAFGAVLVSKFADLKPGYALRALASIPQEYFKRSPGRPPAREKTITANQRELSA